MPVPTLLSKTYRNLLLQKHAKRPWGGTGGRYASSVVKRLPPRACTVLDYGCGKGHLKPALYELRKDVIVYEYDPGIPGKDQEPPRVDVLVCTDVLEHVEYEFLPQTLRYLDTLTIDKMFLIIAVREAGSSLPDGRNTHLIIQPAEWWIAQLNEHLPDFEIEVFEDNYKQLGCWLERHNAKQDTQAG